MQYCFTSHQSRIQILATVAMFLMIDMDDLPALIKIITLNMFATKSMLFYLTIIRFTTIVAV